MAGIRFQQAYLEGLPPWDIGRPQRPFVRLFEEGRITGRVLDLGCGTGENALYLAARGLDVLGVDIAEEAIRKARLKAAQRGVNVHFDVADVLDLNEYSHQFDTAVDSGAFHVFDDEDRRAYVTSVHTALRPSGRLFLCCFSELEPGDWGPRRVTQDELRAAFADGWNVESIERATFETNLDEAREVRAWLATLVRLP
jgi:cyclopropane fatty-acyl-phospholipid synthase-like methyltransferase